ncbi:MAG TPA: GatB/YqeY domain-containing protein [Tepidisphaeraceae bacterium]|jgi:hypothetical protein
MDLVSRLSEDMKTAMKTGQKDRLAVIRMVLSDAKVADLKKITPEQAVEAYAKKLAKGVEEMTKYGKTAEAEQLKRELAVVQEYLPKKATSEDTVRLVEEFLGKNSFTEKQFGQAMGAFMKAHGSHVDAGTANRVLKEKLAGK